MPDKPDPASPLLPLHEWSALKTELIWIYDRPVHPDMRQWKGPGQEMPGYRFWLIRQGSVTMKHGAKAVTVGSGRWTAPFRKASEVSFSPNAHLLSLHFLCHWPSGENILTGEEGLSFESGQYPLLEKLARRMHRNLRRQYPERGSGEHFYNRKSATCHDFLNLQSELLRWIAAWSRIEVEHGARLTRLASGDDRSFRAARHLNLAPLDQPFPQTQLQRETGLGLMRLNQLFLSEFGLTTRKYWDRRRLQYARQCLETSWMPVKEIAGSLGFRSDSHFVVWFRRFSGSRPGDYGKKYQDKRTSGLALES